MGNFKTDKNYGRDGIILRTSSKCYENEFYGQKFENNRLSQT